MSRPYHSATQSHVRDSLELASLASIDPDVRTSLSSNSSRNLFEDDAGLHNFKNAAKNTGNAKNRSYSLFSVFDFRSSFLHLSSTNNSYAAIGAPNLSHAQSVIGAGSLEKHKSLTYLNGLSLIVGSVIGSGIFSSPSQVNINTGSAGASLVVWIVAGILAWTGASSYAELGGAIPLNGGAQVYLAKIFGELLGFLFTWCAIIVLKPGSTAIVSIIMGEYLAKAALGSDAESVSVWISKGIALIGLSIVTFLNCVSTKIGTKMSDMLMFLKLAALIGITLTGIIVAATGLSYSGRANQDWKVKGWFEGTSTNAGHWAVALYSGLWAYDGWDTVSSYS